MSLSEMLLEDAEWWFSAEAYVNLPSLETMNASMDARIDWRAGEEMIFPSPPESTSWYLLFIREAMND